MIKTTHAAALLIAAAIFAGLPSCKKKKDDPEPSTQVKVIIDSTRYITSTGDTSFRAARMTLSYDGEKLSMVKLVNEDYGSGGGAVDSVTRTYSYVDDKCIVTSTAYPWIDTLYLDGKRITKINSDAVSYDSDSKIASFRTDKFTWADGNVVSILSGSDTTKFTYTTSTGTALSNLFVLSDYLRYGHTMFTNKNLVASYQLRGSGSGQDGTYEYSFDESRRVTQVTQSFISYGSGFNSSAKSNITFQY